MRGSGSAKLPKTAGRARPGIYGFALVLEEADKALGARMIPAAAGWPELRLRHTVEHVQLTSGEPSAMAEGQLRMDEDRARAQLSEGGVGIMRRDTDEAWFRTSVALTVEELVHPLLGYATLAFAYWMGRESFHAGVFLCGNGVWALLGERGAGKSSTLAWLARDDQRILADDLLVLDGQTAFAGPRMIDLTPASASHLGLTEDLEQVRRGYRRRMPLDSLAPEYQLRGWVSLTWGDEVRMTPMPAPEQIPLLIEHGHQPRGVANWSNILALASLPTFELSRPHRLESLAPACELLLATIAAEADPA